MSADLEQQVIHGMQNTRTMSVVGMMHVVFTRNHIQIMLNYQPHLNKNDQSIKLIVVHHYLC
jgi:hypothetical protein